jgi:DNA-binding CsgD family transcriptional regulator
MSEKWLSALIGDIYDAALDPALWPEVLEKSSTFVGGGSASLYSKDSVSKTANINYAVGMETRYIQCYEEKYVKIDPTTPGFFFFDVGEIISIEDILPVQEFLETRFYREWAQPRGWVDTATAVLEKSGTSYAVFSVFRHERDGMVDDAVRDRMRLIVPHIRRAMLIGKTIQLKRAEAATLADTLDSLAASLFLVDATGRLIEANISGHAMLAEGTVLRASGGRLIANEQTAEQTLRDAFAGAEGGDASLGTQGIAVPLVGTDGQRYLAHILPLTSGARRKAGVRYAAAAAMFVRKAQLETPAAPEVMAKLYGLTPSELRVLLAVFESGSVSGIADALGISEGTAKTHLRRLFGKTNTKRQADLVKLVAGFAGPGR